MNDSKFLIKVENRVDKLLQNYTCFILLQKTISFCVLIQVSFCQYLGHNVYVGLGLELS